MVGKRARMASAMARTAIIVISCALMQLRIAMEIMVMVITRAECSFENRYRMPRIQHKDRMHWLPCLNKLCSNIVALASNIDDPWGVFSTMPESAK